MDTAAAEPQQGGRDAARRPGLAWDWSDAVLGAVYALPAAAVALDDPPRGIALAVGVLPAAIVGLAPRRRGRAIVVVLGALTGLPLLLGAVLANVPLLAVLAIGLLGVGAAQLAARLRIGMVAMVLSLPMVGVGLSYGDDIGKAAGLAGLMVTGSVVAFLLSLAWPERQGGGRQAGGLLPASVALSYGIRLGAAGATAAAIGFLLDLDHVGWACAAALLVMRPSAEMLRLRGAGRILAVLTGALAAIAIVELDPAAAWYALAAVATISCAAATRTSRWYVTSAFTTFLVFLLLLYANLADAESRFLERALETLLGVGLAYLFGLAIPALARRRGGLREAEG